jgi:Fe-S cluster assembly ATPase SufC
MSCNARRQKLGQPELDPLQFYAHVMPKLELLNMDPTFLNRNVNEGFSGGEKKRNEILQLAVLEVRGRGGAVAEEFEHFGSILLCAFCLEAFLS